jgi:hypothetical protein
MLIKAKKPTIAKIHILFLWDTVSAMTLLSLQQSAALGAVIVPDTMASTCHLLFGFLVFHHTDKNTCRCFTKIYCLLLQGACHIVVCVLNGPQAESPPHEGRRIAWFCNFSHQSGCTGLPKEMAAKCSVRHTTQTIIVPFGTIMVWDTVSERIPRGAKSSLTCCGGL